MEEKQAEAEEAQAVKVLRLEMRIDPEQNQRLEKIANYAALEGLIPSDHRGNKTAWINYCLMLGEEALKQRAYQKRGF
ncbi:unnamed protein product [marine sediment metagenome]|uniref:Uncharacterized protein n=1 Tax=marine sediment metagenome TaxID=412755 RepID=X1UEW9_9ZZZZ